MSRLTLLFTALIGGSLMGCVMQPRPYAARTSMVDQSGGPAEASRRLDAVLKRATVPRVSTVEVTPTYMRYQAPQLLPFDQPGPLIWRQVFWAQLDRIDVYENNRAFIYMSGVEKGWLQFTTPQDAEEFADLMMSFKTWAATQSGAPAPSAWKGNTPEPLAPGGGSGATPSPWKEGPAPPPQAPPTDKGNGGLGGAR